MAKTHTPEHSKDPTQRYNWPIWETLPPLEAAPRQDFDFGALSNAAKIAYRQFSETDDAAGLSKAIRRFDRSLSKYQSNKVHALLKLLEAPDSAEANARYQDFILEEPEYETLVNTVYQPLLAKTNLAELADFFGKNLFLRMQNRQILFKTELTELLQMEKLLLAQGPELHGLAAYWQKAQRALASATPSFPDIQAEEEADLSGFAAENRRREAGKSQSELYLQLFAQRRQLAEALNLPNFRELALLRLEHLESRLPEIEKTVALIHNYFVPLAVALRRERSASDGMSSSSAFYAWQTYLPDIKKLPEIDATETDLSFVSAFLSRVLKGYAPHFLLRLQEKSYLRLQTGGKKAWADALLLPSAGLPCILGQASVNAAELPYLLEAAGLAYGYLCNYDDGSFVLMREPSPELRKIWAAGLLFLSADYLPQLFEEAEVGQKYRELFLEHTVQRLCFQAMLFEFENECCELQRVDRESFERSWSRVIRRYYPDLAEDSAWLRMQRGSYMYLPQLWNGPFTAVAELQAMLVGLEFWDRSREERQEAVNAYETLCTLGSSDSVPNLLEQARLADPWSEGSVKRLVYQLAYYLGY